MDTPRSWSELLSQMVEDPQEKQRIAQEIGVNPLTLSRWIKGESQPRIRSLHRLVQVLPRQRDLLVRLLEKDFPGFSTDISPSVSQEVLTTIPPTFYDTVLRARALTPESLRLTNVGHLVLQQIMQHLDPDRLGLATIVVLCLPPSEGQQVRSLRETLSLGTAPWPRDLGASAILLGSESLAGYAAIQGRIVARQSLENDAERSPGYGGPWGKSAAAAPIMLAGRIAGSLLVSSTQPHYFVPPYRTLVQSYADLFGTLLNPEDFYDLSRIELGWLPPYEVQVTYFPWLRQRALQIMARSLGKKPPVTYPRAEQMAWQEFEQRLLAPNAVQSL